MEDYLKNYQFDPKTEYKCCEDHYCAGFNQLMYMIITGVNSPKFRWILNDYIDKHPSELNSYNNNGWTPLMLACVNTKGEHNSDVVDLLLKKGADPNLQDKFGWTALMMVSGLEASSNSFILNALLKNKADPNIKNIFGYTALMYACKYTNKYAACLLVNHGADVNLQNNNGDSALIILMRNKFPNIEIAQMLLDAGADINLCNSAGCSALMTVFLQNKCDANREIINLLVANGANPLLKNNRGDVIYDIISNNESSINALFNALYDTVNKQNEKNKQLEEKIKFYESSIKFYESTLKLHPDGEYIMSLKDDFFSKNNF